MLVDNGLYIEEKSIIERQASISNESRDSTIDPNYDQVDSVGRYYEDQVSQVLWLSITETMEFIKLIEGTKVTK